jgi:hypothetical protein
MGTWDTSIESSDTYLDVYSAFMERYNSGDEPRQITQDFLSEYSDYFNDTDDKNNALFGLGKAQWETKTLDKETFEKIKEVINSGGDLELWKELGATDDLIKKRKDRLNKFLKTISTEREKPKKRIKKKFEFEKIEIIKLVSPDKRKTLDIGEEFGDKKYIHTSGLLMWDDGGGSILYFNQPNQTISAQWIDNGTLEITHDKNIVFSKKDEKAFYMGDEVIIKYRLK